MAEIVPDANDPQRLRVHAVADPNVKPGTEQYVEVVVPLSDLTDVDLTQHPPTGTLPSTWKKRDLNPPTDLEAFRAMLTRAGIAYEENHDLPGVVRVKVSRWGTVVLSFGTEDGKAHGLFEVLGTSEEVVW